MTEIHPTETNIYNAEAIKSYNIWTKNAPYLYDELITTSTRWPSQTVEFFDYACYDEKRGITTQDFLTCTQTSGVEQEFLMIKRLEVPDLQTEQRHAEYREKGEAYEFGINTQLNENSKNNANKNKVNATHKLEGGITNHIVIPVEIEINRARICPFANNLIACRGDSPDVMIYDYSCHQNYQLLNDNQPRLSYQQTKSDYKLKGHTKGGFGICWSKLKRGYLASAGDDGKVCVFDIEKTTKANSSNKTLNRIFSSTKPVTDVSFSKTDENLLAFVGDDRMLHLCDLRQDINKESINKENINKVSDSDIFSVDFPQTNSTKISIGCADGKIKIFDIRKVNNKYPQRVLTGHSSSITSVKFNEVNDNLLVSASVDKKVIVWDLENSIENHKCLKKVCDCFEEGVPELKFIHGGHLDEVNDVNWNPVETNEIISVAHDCQINVFKPNCLARE